MAVEYGILGPVEVRHDGRFVHIGGPQRRAVLAALLLDANRTVSADRLVDLLWPEPPTAARTLVHGCIARLRRTLDGTPDGPLITRPPGYLLRVGPDELDLHRFDRLVTAAGAEGDPGPALRSALGLWRGPALADIELPDIRVAAVALDERMMSVLEARIDADLASGRRDGLVGELSALVHRHPLRERLWAQLMLARCAAQRPAEALAAYRELRRGLIDRLGIEPGALLRRMERAILADEDVWAVYRTDTGRPVARLGQPAPGARSDAPHVPPSPPGVPPAEIPPAGVSLVGRAAEVVALHGALARLAAGPVLLGIGGDPGIGKSRLLAELSQLAEDAGLVVLSGRGAELERDVPFGVLRNALDDHLRSADVALDLLTDDERLLLPSAFPTLGGPRPDGPEPGAAMVAAERYRLHRSIRTLLGIVAEPPGLVLILDDLHWCDEGSAELIAHLLRHPPTAPVLLAFAYRPRQLATRLHHEIVGATRRGTATVLDLGPLTFEQATGLLPRGLSQNGRRQLYDAAEGNPFYLDVLSRRSESGLPGSGLPGSGRELSRLPFRATPDAASLPARADDVSRLPEPVRAALAGELAQLPTAHQRVAHAAALSGDAADADLIAVVADMSLTDTMAALDEWERRDVIRARGSGYPFRHPLLRSAAYQHASPGWRVGAHARAAAELARRGAPAVERAAHVALSATVGDLDAVHLLQAAAADAISVVPAAAANWLDAALRLLPGRADTAGLRLELLNAQATALGITGDLARSRDILTEVLRLVPPGSPQRVAVLGFLAMMTHLLGNHLQAHSLLEGELATLTDQHGTAAGSLRVAVVLAGVLRGSAEDDDIRTAVTVARGTGDRPLLACALAVGAVASRSFEVGGRHTAGWADEAADLVDAMSDAELARRLDAALYLGWAESYLERFTPATNRVNRALAIARRTGQGHLIGPLRMLLGILHCMTGDLPRAAVALDDAMEAAVLTGSEETRGRLLAYMSWISVWTGDIATAVELAEESVTLASGGQGMDWQTGQAVSHLAFVRVAAGDPDGAIELMLRTGGGPGLPAVRQVWQPSWLDTLSAAAAATGRLSDAGTYAAKAAALSTAATPPRRAAIIRMAQVHPLTGSAPVEAARCARQAAGLFDRAGDRLGAARARFLGSVAHRAAGESAAADDLAQRALYEFAARGAHPTWLTG